MNGDVGMHHAKNCENKSSLSNTIKDSIIEHKHMSRQRVTHDTLDTISKGTSCFYNFSHGASLQCHSFSCALVHVKVESTSSSHSQIVIYIHVPFLLCVYIN